MNAYDGENDWAKGLGYFRDNNKMDALVGFLVVFVRNVHCDRYFTKFLVNNPGRSYIDAVTASDMAYAATLLKTQGRYGWRRMIMTGR